MGPVPGDIAEIEAYCRIFRSAEWLHAALMDTLCNPVTGECYVSYDFTADEKPVMEDKIVSVLGCIVSLLNKGREEVLSGRSSMMNLFRDKDVSTMEDDAPPLAAFRSEMKRCCESLHVALENYLIPGGDERSLDVWRKLQRLRNVCYDSGFPRAEDYPNQALFANWSPVYFSVSKEENGISNPEVAFWRGGQVTEEGLDWLVEKGFKTIVDLRAEDVKDRFYQVALGDAVSSGKIELIKIPVKVGTAPSMEQVEKFALLASDSSKRPIYLHSKEGARRTSAMISRWRQYVNRSASQLNSNQSIGLDDALSQDKNRQTDGKTISAQAKEPTTETETETDSPKETSDSVDGFRGLKNEATLSEMDSVNGSSNGVHNDLSSVQDKTLGETSNGWEEALGGFTKTNPLKAQVPPCNVFSKKEMSKFMKTKRFSFPTLHNRQSNMLGKKTVRTGETLSTNPMPGLVGAGNSNGSYNEKTGSKLQNQLSAEEKYSTSETRVSVGSTVKGSGEHKAGAVGNLSNAPVDYDNANLAKPKLVVKENQKGNGRAPVDSNEEEAVSIEGDMCASTTGVVRVQSRKKAEMFLVRTDGFSCSREKVTEASLAFTHPSTQQQMLMWKTPPKTVLLLKKLGNELMEEAKEVTFKICSFPIYLFR